MQPRPLVFNPPPPPQFQSVWSNPNTETYMQPPTMMNPITQYVQVRITYILLSFFLFLMVLRDFIDGDTLKISQSLLLLSVK